jgi:hypothetical protein
MAARQNWFLFRCVTLLLILSSIITGCDGSPPILTLDANPRTEVQVGKEVAIVASVNPPEHMDLKWSIASESTAKGTLNPDTGERVIFKASQTGTAFIVAEGNTTTSKQPIKQTVTLTIVDAEVGIVPTQAATQVPITAATTAAPQPTAQPTASPQRIETTTQPSATASPAPATEQPTPGAVTITSLQDGQLVDCDTLVQGTYASDVTGKIWPVILAASKYHPQDVGGHAPPMNNGKLIATVHFGDCSQPARDTGKPFQLFIVIANQEANQAFEDYFTTAQSRGFPGMVVLPDGVTVIGPISVTRR